MNQNLFLAPASTTGSAYSHLEQSVVNGIRLNSNISNSDRDGDLIRIWGINSGLESTWNNIEVNDWILFYTGDNEYRLAAQIIRREENPQLGSEIRNRHLDVSKREKKEGKDWHFLLYLGDPIKIELCAETLSEWLNYERAYRSRFHRVPERRLQKIEGKFDTLEDMVMAFTVN